MKKLILFGFMMVLTIAAIGQRTITGTITDDSGETLIGVNVLEKGTLNGAATDIDGVYTIDVSSDAAILEFSYTGMTTQDVVVAGRSTIDVVLSEDAELLEEVVVSALGFKQKKDELGSTASVVAPEVMQRSGEANLLNALGGKASGVQINRSNGDPGAGSTIRIRGANSIGGSSNPLVILDGIPISNSTNYVGTSRTGGTSQGSRLNDINPNDIESIQVLKGASAAALWGSRAANGVLVITTKEGQSGKPKISFKSSLSFDEVNQRYELQNTFGQGQNGVYSPTRAESWGDYIPDRSGGADDVNTAGEYYEAADGSLYYPISNKNSRETFVDSNWDEVFQTGGFFQNDLSISGGTDKSKYFFSLGRIDQEGIIKESDYDRTNLRLNNKFYFTDWLNMSSKASYSHTKSNRIQQSSNTGGLLLGLLRTSPDFDNSDYIGTYHSSAGEAFPNRQRAYRRYLGNNVNPIYNNPGWTVNEQESSTAVDRYIFSSEINILPTDFLQVILRGGIDTYNDKRLYFFPIGSGARVTGRFDEDLIRNQEFNFDGIVRATTKINSDIGLVATVGWNFNDRRYQRNSSDLVGFQVNTRKQTFDLNTSADATSISRALTNRRTNRGYATLNFDLYNQLYVNLGGAIEAASTARNTFFYPSADVAWQFSKLNGFNNDGVLSFGKLRVSYGQVGIAPPVHAAQTLAEGGFTYSTYSDPLDVSNFGGGFRLDNNRGNASLIPEIKTEWEIGTDLRFFDDRLSLGLTYYQNKIDGLIIQSALSPSFGFSTERGNVADMENTGFEADVNYDLFKNESWDIGLSINWSTNDNLVTNLSGTETIDLSGGSVSSRAIVGHPLGVLYGTGSQTNADGSFTIDDTRPGFPKITTSPIVLGDPNADWRGGLGININYKKLAVNALIEHSQGGTFSPRTLHVLNRFGTTAVTANRFTTTEDLRTYGRTVIPAGTTVRGNLANFGDGNVLLDESWYRQGIGGGFGDAQAYNFSVYDATFTRFRELSLSYTFDGKGFQDKTKLGSIMISATGRNLILWDNIPGVDPEINQTGVGNGGGLDYFTNPSTRSFLFSITVTY